MWRRPPRWQPGRDEEDGEKFARPALRFMSSLQGCAPVRAARRTAARAAPVRPGTPGRRPYYDAAARGDRSATGPHWRLSLACSGASPGTRPRRAPASGAADRRRAPRPDAAPSFHRSLGRRQRFPPLARPRPRGRRRRLPARAPTGRGLRPPQRRDPPTPHLPPPVSAPSRRSARARGVPHKSGAPAPPRAPRRRGGPTVVAGQSASPARSTARKASCGISTDPTAFIRFLPSFCRSRSFRFRLMSPP